MLEEDKELYEIINNLNEELDEVLELLDEPIQEYKKREIDENLSEKKIENKLPEIVKSRESCCC